MADKSRGPPPPSVRPQTHHILCSQMPNTRRGGSMVWVAAEHSATEAYGAMVDGNPTSPAVAYRAAQTVRRQARSNNDTPHMSAMGVSRQIDAEQPNFRLGPYPARTGTCTVNRFRSVYNARCTHWLSFLGFPVTRSALLLYRIDYLPLVGTRLCSSSKKFRRNITRSRGSCVSAGMSATMRLPSGAGP